MPETHLVARFLRGDEAAARELYVRNWRWVYRLAHRILGNPQDAEDATQRTFVRAFEHLPRFRGDASFPTWLRSIAMSVSLNAVHHARRHEDREQPVDPDGLSHSDAERDPHLWTLLHRSIDALPERMRVTLIMHDMEGYTHTDIAETLGIAEATSRVHLTKARERVRRDLARAGVRGRTHD